MKQPLPRLQGAEWRNKKHELTPIKYIENQNGHIKGIYKDKEGKKYTHWLNDDEIEELKEGEINVSKGNV